ncbi:SMC-Scp complex subunit ScpB [Thalassotalea castellviae]|uniref:SMC-Scp complex subunit ScpB n=1 Tax=Thalassotalea castellviae TaxID=3075612 RepID=A0ABU3A4V3_9GAMM|nr:SMC-Scp complex subunit ScpB [Thalassotalea sp. W431]MDT0604562.1 SMC-Scp complex subunit ScpB [Thalassotalea sp. W431]
MISTKHLEQLIEAAIFSSVKPLSVKDIKEKLLAHYEVSTPVIKQAITNIEKHYQSRGVYLVEVASGFQFQIKAEHNEDIARLTEEKPQKYSRALLETLALIAYKQPITRSEIEDVRGVAVSSQIIKTLIEREWIKVLGHKEVPGRPSMYGTTKAFLDYFSLKSLEQLPELIPIEESSIVNGTMQDIMASNE